MKCVSCGEEVELETKGYYSFLYLKKVVLALKCPKCGNITPLDEKG